MPAIQPDQLQRQIDTLLELVTQPQAFVRECMNLLDYYADRTKRPRGSAIDVEIARILRVPRPVMRTLCNQLQQTDQGESDLWLQIAQGLWNKGIREAREIAACALFKSPMQGVVEVAEQWAINCEDDVALEYLTTTGMKGWRTQEPQRFYQATASWLRDHRLRIRHMAILALLGLSKDEAFSEIPEVLNVLSSHKADLRGGSLRSQVSLVRQLAALSPPEVAKYLIDAQKEGGPGVSRLIQSVLSAFPTHLQNEILNAQK